ncbi:MAG: hypothetical protein R3F53_07625 [Gammaproteobacteria bacterium]
MHLIETDGCLAPNWRRPFIIVVAVFGLLADMPGKCLFRPSLRGTKLSQPGL